MLRIISVVLPGFAVVGGGFVEETPSLCAGSVGVIVTASVSSNLKCSWVADEDEGEEEEAGGLAR